jgi:peptide deformylase
MKRRDLLKFGLLSALAATAGTGFLKIYQHHTGVKKIIEFPAPILRKTSSPVDAIDDTIISLSQQLIATLRYYSLIGFFSKAFLSRGLAAPQVGVPKRLIACGIHGEIKVLLNPEVVEKRGTYCGYESCLSLPDTERKIINRPDFIKVEYKGLDNSANELAATNEYAALLTHEIDHLNGILFIDYEHADLDA